MDSNFWELYEKHGEYNIDKYYIQNHYKWDYFSKNEKLYKKKKRQAFYCLLIPIIGIIFADLIFSEMGISFF